MRGWSAANREKTRATANASRARNRDARNTNRRRARHADPEFNAKQRAWRRANPNYRIAADQSSRRRLANRKATGGEYSEAEWQLVLWIYQHKCAYCRNSVPLCVDHVVPVSKGGNSFIENLVPACRPCNASKGNRDVDEWLTRMAS